MALAACSSDPASSAPPNPAFSDATVGGSAVDSGGYASLLQYYAYAGGSPNDVNIERQRVIASCMRDQGWEYYPPPEEVLRSSEPNELHALKEYRSSRGYGISTSVESDFSRDTDPNLAYVRDLSDSARASYYVSLNGGATDGSGSPPGGCELEANDAAQSELPIFDANVQIVLADMATDLNADPRYQAAVAEWSGCMSDKGFMFESPDAAPQSIFDEMNQATNQDDFVDVQAHEILVAQADFDCAVEHLLSVQNSVNAELVQRYVDAGRLQAEFTDVTLP